ncbi:hypothetical protein [Priestia megaterium]|uniref:hypothetical protein n=1 Tax=Priestia megaterium TaxID=1404 RepID=UPI0015AF93F8|nr:hypothetical protein [Priestia megaterium]QLC85415.1 hypothetical protein HW576_02295 [Priestia megaterium]
MLNEELVQKLAKDNEQARETVMKMPPSMQIAYSLASVEYIEKNGIEKVSLSSYTKGKGVGVDEEAMVASMAKRIEESTIKEQIKERQRQEYAEKLRRQQEIQRKIY